MLVSIQDYYVYALIGISGLLFIASLFIFISIKRNCPDAFAHWEAARRGKTICRVHFRGKQTVDYIANIEKHEKDMGTPYWHVPKVGLKFKPEADAIHFIEGSIPCCDYFENIPKSVKVETAVCYSQLRDLLKKLGIPIDGIEDLGFYVMSESERSDPETAIKDARVQSEETKTILRRLIQTIKQNKERIKSIQLDSGVFVWQTAQNALDSTMAYTSASLTHTVETVRAAERRQNAEGFKDYLKYGMFVFMACLGVGALYVMTK